MDKDRAIFDADSEDRRRAFKVFLAKFRDFRIMEDYVNPAKDIDSDDYWISAKRPSKSFPSSRMGCPNNNHRLSNR